MNKELFVSTTPHETKVGITEDDQLAEIYLERENEYTLAGSIYKGRVTRVLPGMQSAFVDIGLERDAFLYVSDFMDLEQQDEDLDEAIPANRPAQGARGEGQPRRNGGDEATAGGDAEFAESGSEQSGGTEAQAGGSSEPSRDSRDSRGRRRRRGRRPEGGDRGRVAGGDRGADRGGERSDSRPETRGVDARGADSRSSESRVEPRSGESRSGDSRSHDSRGHDSRSHEGRNEGGSDRGERPGRNDSRGGSRFQRPSSSTGRSGRDYDYGPPPGYQPIILPGESISKYQRQAQNAAPVAAAAETPAESLIESRFPDDEPIFAAAVTEPLHEEHDSAPHVEIYEETASAEIVDSAAVNAAPEIASLRSALAEEPEAAITSAADLDVVEETHETGREADFAAESAPDGVVQPAATAEIAEDIRYEAAQGRLEEQEIEEEEAELSAYGEEQRDDYSFEEVEEETRGSGGELLPAVAGEASSAASGSAEAGENGEVPEAVLEAEEREAEELELEEAQAEAEALLEAEAIGDGTVDASAQVRGPAPEARLLQRTQRRGFERGTDPDRRRGGRRGQRRRFRSRENQVVPQISELLKEGQEILVQIAKEPIGKKGARITSHIALPGRFLVFMPTVNHTGVSRKISSEDERQRLKHIIQSERENGGGGFIVRTAAAGASDVELRADIRFLKNLWNEIKSRSESSKPPALIYHDLNVVERVLRDQVSSDFSVIWVDTEQEYERIVRFANRFQPALVKRVKLYTKETPLYEQFGLNEELNKALKSKVWLKSGGYIVINQTEALVAIDVNTGKYVGKTSRLEDTIVKTNVDAIREIVRQIRLRDLGGIIIIDFIDMDERRNRQKVMQALEEALRADRAPSKVLQFNDFGLVAITRKRVKQSLERTIGSPCPYCQATGFVKAVNTVCNEIYVEMRKISQHLEHSDVMLRVNPEVAKALKATNARLLNEMEELTKKTIIVKSDPALHQEQFDIH